MYFWQRIGETLSYAIFWTTLAQIAAAVFIALGWIATRKTWLTAKQTQSYQIMLEFMREYGTPEMGNAIRVLHDFYREQGKNTAQMVQVYESIISVPGEKNPAIYRARRAVSIFLQELGVMHHNKVLSAELISGFWHKDDLAEKIEIVITLDTRNLKPAEPLPPAFQNLRDLLEELRGIARQASAS